MGSFTSNGWHRTRSTMPKITVKLKAQANREVDWVSLSLIIQLLQQAGGGGFEHWFPI